MTLWKKRPRGSAVAGFLGLAAAGWPAIAPPAVQGGPTTDLRSGVAPSGAVRPPPESASAVDTSVHRSGAADRESVSVTVYDQGFGLVREIRSLEPGRGLVSVEFRDVPSEIETETVHVRPLAGPDALRLLEQQFHYDLRSQQELLERYVGHTVKLYPRGAGGDEGQAVEAEVVSALDDPVLRIGDEITFGLPGRLAFPGLPGRVFSEPTLVWLMESRRTEQRVEATYLTRGLDWEADYVLIVNEEETRGDLDGRVTLTNRSGAGWTEAELTLVAGDVRRVGEPDGSRVRAAVMEAGRAGGDEQFREEAFFEYHLYTLQRPATLRHDERKQVTLLQADDVSVEKRFVFRGRPHLFRGGRQESPGARSVGVHLEFRNGEASGLGEPLPAGVIRVYRRHDSGAPLFVGEDRIDHTPRNETVRVQVGEAFDVVAERTQTDYEALGRCSSESAWEIRIRNHKDVAVRVDVLEPASGDWEIVSASHAHEEVNQQTFRFPVDVPAGGEETVTYRVRVRWC